MSGNRNAAVSFILITILLDMLGIGLIIPVLPAIVGQFYESNAAGGATMYGWFVASYALMQFLFAPILGNLSDAYGRRPVLLFSLFGSVIDYLMMCWAPNLEWLFVGRIISGITGANITAANAYIADISNSENRARNFGLVGACFGLGFVVGPAVGGLLSWSFGMKAPFFAAAILTGANWLYGYFVLPESHAIENRRPFNWRRVNPFGTLSALKHYPMLTGMVVVIALERLAHAALPSTWVLYTEFKFGWTALQNGLSLALVGLMYAAVQAGLTKKIVGRLGEYRAIVFGLVIGCITYSMYGLAPFGWMLCLAIIFGSIGGVAGPSIQSFITRHVDKTEQGAVQGAITGINGVAAIIGPIMATNLFGFFSSASAPVALPGAPFLVSSLLVGIAAFLAIRSAREPAVEPQAVPDAFIPVAQRENVPDDLNPHRSPKK